MQILSLWFKQRCNRVWLSVCGSANFSNIPFTVMMSCVSIFMLSCRYGKAFEIEPTLHSGINDVVLLIAAGHEFDTSIELRKIGVFVCPSFSFTALVVSTLNSEMVWSTYLVQ